VKKFSAIVAVLLLAFPAWALELTLPATIQVGPGRLKKIEVKTDTKTAVKWFVSSTDADLIPSESGKYAIFASTVPGVYQVVAYTSDNNGPSDPAICQITVGVPVPPVPPAPSDPFFATLTTAWKAEAPGQQATVQQLAALYQTAGSSTINDTSLNTAGDFLAKVKAAADSLIPATALPKVRAALATELSSHLPTAPTAPLDAATRQTIGAQFVRMANLLEALK
jgi:hypothetical protein